MALPVTPRGLVLASASRAARVARRPTHVWTTQTRPFQIQPFMIAPVLPGETLKEFNMASRIVTDPVASSLVGWWAEHYWYYVSHRMIDSFNGADTLQNMVLQQGADISALYDVSKTATYHFSSNTVAGNVIDFVQQAMQVAVQEDFRKEGEAWDDFTLDSMPVAAINLENWMESLTPAADMPVGDTIAAGDTMAELDRMRQQYDYLRGVGLTEMSYEDWLSTYGVRLASVEVFKPELLRYSREWQYPSNTVDPTTGTPKSAVSWSVTVNANKDRFFKEPGFIIGLQCFRPKVYRKNQRGAAIGLLNDAFAWMPAIMKDDPATSLKFVDKDDGPIKSQTTDYYLDIRDLYTYGDQFANYDLDTTVAAAGKLAVELPTAAGVTDYITDTDEINDLFASGTSSANKIHADGRCDLVILGTQIDHT